VHAQQQLMPVERYLDSLSSAAVAHRFAILSQTKVPDNCLMEAARSLRLSFIIAFAAAFFILSSALRGQAVAEDVLQAAVNYVFTGTIAPENGPKIVDLKSCVVVMPDQRNKRYVRYYLSRFKMDSSRISKTYSGRQTNYTLEVDGDDVIIEYLKLDQTTILNGYKSAQISLPGNIDQTERALHLIFTEHCKSDRPKTPF
jgi:hypothetical protein